MTPEPVEVVVEVGARRAFAAALDWPGWVRSGRGEEAALAALEVVAVRYAAVAARAGLALPDAFTLSVVERGLGTATTDFGAPDLVAERDRAPLAPAPARRLEALVRAAWAELDAVAARTPAGLRKGPRGGGRDRDPILAHVIAAEAAYSRKLGLRLPAPSPADPPGLAAFRDHLAAAIGAGEGGAWPVPYAARRIAWHALDHAWEMEDRSGPV